MDDFDVLRVGPWSAPVTCQRPAPWPSRNRDKEAKIRSLRRRAAKKSGRDSVDPAGPLPAPKPVAQLKSGRYADLRQTRADVILSTHTVFNHRQTIGFEPGKLLLESVMLRLSSPAAELRPETDYPGVVAYYSRVLG